MTGIVEVLCVTFPVMSMYIFKDCQCGRKTSEEPKKLAIAHHTDGTFTPPDGGNIVRKHIEELHRKKSGNILRPSKFEEQDPFKYTIVILELIDMPASLHQSPPAKNQEIDIEHALDTSVQALTAAADAISLLRHSFSPQIKSSRRVSFDDGRSSLNITPIPHVPEFKTPATHESSTTSFPLFEETTRANSIRSTRPNYDELILMRSAFDQLVYNRLDKHYRRQQVDEQYESSSLGGEACSEVDEFPQRILFHECRSSAKATPHKPPFIPPPRQCSPKTPVTNKPTPPASPTLDDYRKVHLNAARVAAGHRAVLRNTPKNKMRSTRQTFHQESIQKGPPSTPHSKWRENTGHKPKQFTKDEYCVGILNSGACNSKSSGPVHDIIIIDGIIVVAHHYKVINLWNTRTRQFLKHLKGHKGPVRCLASHTPRNYLISGGEDCDIRLWSLPEYTAAFVLSGHTGHITALEVSRKDELLISVSEDRSVRLWDLRNDGNPFRCFENGHSGGIFSVQCIHMKEGKLPFTIATAGRDRVIKLWKHLEEFGTDETISHFGERTTLDCAPHLDAVTSICSPPAAVNPFTVFFTAGRDMNIRVWSALNGDPLSHYVHVHRDWITGLQYLPRRGALVSVSKDGSICVWDAVSGELGTLRAQYSLHGHHGAVNAVCCLNNEQEMFVTGGMDGLVRIWNPPPIARRRHRKH